MTEEQGWQQWALKNLAKIQNTGAFEPGPIDPEPLSVGVHVQPRFDPLETLPAAAADRLRLLRQRGSDAHAIIPAGFDIQEASATKIEAANALRRLIDHPQDGGFGFKPTDVRVVAAEKHLDKMTADFARLQELQTLRTAQWHAASSALANAEAWLKHGKPSGVQLLDYDGPEPKLLKNESITDAIERLRRRVRELRADAHRVSSSPYPSSYCKARACEMVEQLAARGAPSVAMLIEHDGDLIWPMTRQRSEVLGAEQRALAFAEVPDTIALLAWLHRDTLIKRLDAEIDTESDDASALTHEQRQQAEAAEAMADLLAVERDESWLVWQAQQQGLPCEHRADISPLALLSITLITPPRADGLPPTSAGHSWDLRR